MSNRTVLIVDDDPDIRDLYKLVLQKDGLAVDEAESGPEALTKINQEKPDLVLLDVMMPEMDGYEVCRRIRSDPQTADLLVLMFSARSSSTERRNGILAGADDFLTKVVGPRAVMSRIQALLSASFSGNKKTSTPTTSFGFLQE